MTENNNGNELAFPISLPELINYAPGLTKREYFAAMAMQGLLANSSDWDDKPTNFEWVARVSGEYADALLNQLNKNNGQ